MTQFGLIFATHEVTLRGHPLRRVETSMQRMELSFLAALPDNQRSLISEGQPVILEDAQTESESQDKPLLTSKE